VFSPGIPPVLGGIVVKPEYARRNCCKQTNLSDPERLSKLIALLALAFCTQLIDQCFLFFIDHGYDLPLTKCLITERAVDQAVIVEPKKTSALFLL
jgi:hypothetical protein